MPRKANRQLPGRILGAAYRLWCRGGEDALTMRAVAVAARTTTPTVYQCFRDKRDIRDLLRRQAQQNLFSAIQPARTLADFCQRYFNFALRHRNEYELIHADWAVRLAHEEPRPSLEHLKKRLAIRLGGVPSDHNRLALSLAALVHGTATLLLTKGVQERIANELRHACIAAFESLVRSNHHQPSRPKRRKG